MSNIEWTGETWNPIVGCSLESPGCTNCYAMPMAARLEAMGVPSYEGLTEPSKAGPVWNGRLAFSETALHKPLKRRKAQTYFVNSMGDLFHEDCSDEWIDQVFIVMNQCPQHTFQILTKRAARMKEYLSRAEDRQRSLNCYSGFEWIEFPLSNVWLGVSAEDQKRFDERIDDLCATPAAVRWVSMEPLLGPIETGFYLHPDEFEIGIDWVVVGGESGPKARKFDPDWARSLRDQCSDAETPFFMKQMGGAVKSKLPPIPDDLNIRQFPKAMGLNQ